MKKHTVLIMNIALIVLIIGAIGFTVFRILTAEPKEPEAASTVEATAAETRSVTKAGGEKFKIGIVQHVENTASDNCYAGFISEMNTLGLLDSVDIMYVIETDDDRCRAEIQRLIDEGCDLLCTIGTFASKEAAALTDEIPIVFAAVSDPEEVGIVKSNEEPGGNVTGVSSYTPCFEQIDLIPLILPQAKTIGAIYSGTDEAAVRQAIIASKEAEDIGLSAKRYPVGDKDALSDALSDIKSDKIDVIYVPIDSFIYDNFDTIQAFAAKNKIPVICGNEKTLKKGALATCEINYISIGKHSADLSCDILFEDQDPAELRVIYKYGCYNLVNEQTMDELGVVLPDEAVEQIELKNYDE